MGVLPFIGALVCLIVLLLSFPEIATWLPDLMGGGR
jgi:C4-dicarboxylate transporter DctM subunit